MRQASPAPAPLLRADHISYAYGSTEVLRDVSLEAANGEIVCLLGPSGCGKSTLLRVIVGLVEGYQGTVRLADEPLDGVPVHQRGFGLMFQDFALFPHRTVAENVAFGLRMQHQPSAVIASRVAATLELVGLPGYGDRTIFALSGGERQRVALARSLAPQPRLLLLDEPLGALDRTLRERLTTELRTIIKQVGLTCIYVTHDQAEAFAVADRLAVMEAGRIVQTGPPAAIYRTPATVFVARFLGFDNLIPGTVVASDQGTSSVQTALGTLRIAPSPAFVRGTAVEVVIRPEAALAGNTGIEQPAQLTAVVRATTFHGATERTVLEHQSGIFLTLDLPAGQQVGQTVNLTLNPAALTCIIAESPQPRSAPTRNDGA